MTSASEIHLVGRIVEILDEMHSWCGETHIQKTAYVAKVIENVPFESKFILYKHGPYSFDMNGVLNHMRGQNILLVTPQGAYGSSYRLNEGIWSALSRATGARFDAFDESLRFVCTQFARKKVAELERIATAVYVHLNFTSLNPQEQIRKLNELKPHIGIPEAQLAFTEAKVFFQKA
jgi:uncharacterized protein YwgA